MQPIPKILPLMKALNASSGVGSLPPGASQALAYLYYVHRLQTWNEHWQEATSSSANLAKYFAGAGAKWSCKDGMKGFILNATAHILLVSRNLITCINQFAKLQKAYGDWYLACSLKTPIAASYKISFPSHQTPLPSYAQWLGRGTYFTLQLRMYMLAKRTSHIFLCTVILFKEALLMSHHLALLVESLSTEFGEDGGAAKRVILNMSWLLDGCSENKELFLMELHKQEKQINGIFESVNINLNAQHLIDVVEKILLFTEGGKKIIDNSSEILTSGGEGVLKAVGQIMCSLVPVDTPKFLYSAEPSSDEAPKKVFKKTLQKKPPPLLRKDDVLKRPNTLREIEQRTILEVYLV